MQKRAVGNIAVDKPAKAPPLYEGGHDKSTDVPAQNFCVATSAATRQSSRQCFKTECNVEEDQVHYATIALLVLAACSQRQEKLPQGDANLAAPASQPESPKSSAKPFSFDQENELIEFHYGWSAEAAAVPKLVEQFQREMKMEKAGLLTVAKADKAMRDKEGWPYHRLSQSTDHRTAGQSDRLLILAVDHASFTGGAHGNYGTTTIYWDRTAAAEIGLGDLFASIDNLDRLLTQRWCDALNKARVEKRGEPAGEGGMFDECPKLSEVAMIPTDKDGNGKLDRFLLVADPYVAGPYSEGSYEIELAVTSDVIAALKEEYRQDFEVGQTQ